MLRRSLLVVTVALALQAFPSLATTPGGVVTPILARVRLTAPDTVTPVHHARMVGFSWTSGTAAVRLRWHTQQGWSAWQTAEQDTTEEGLPGTVPQWRPAGADLVEVRGTAPDLKLLTVTDGAVHRVFGTQADAATGTAVLGDVHSRASWGADESIRRGGPSYASKVVAVTVHHTDNLNGYKPADVPAILRADYAYHVQGRGWNDVGYNLLVDQFGGIWEGRYGGLGRATIGAHAQGFNTGTLGVSMIGDMTRTTASAAAERAFARVIGYAASSWHFDPTTSVRLRSAGSARYASGQVVTLPRVFGHGQTGQTDCPGSLQGRLAALARAGLAVLAPAPRIVKTTVDGAPVHAPTPASVTGALSVAAPWTITLYDDQNAILASAKGGTSKPAISWNGTRNGVPVAPGSTVRWRLVVADGYHPAATRSGTFQVGLPALG